VGQFYAINVDNEQPYNVYGGLQDNGVWVGPHSNTENTRWHQTGEYGFESIMGGDGMQVQIDNRNSNIVYTGFQFGNYFRLNRETGEQTYIQPKHELGESPYRFNWQTPILLSSHNQDILYYGGNKLMRSMNQGDDWQAISYDLTQGGKPGNVAYGTITSISESPYEFGLIYTGSDDGLVQITRNGGGNWKNVSASFPKDLWVSRVVASEHKKARAYVTLNGYRWDDFKPYVYITEDFGNTWQSINGNLPASPVNVIREDPENMNVLYLGTDNGAYVSLDRGASWHPFSEGFTNVAVHDIVVQAQSKHLLLGTHGRSIYLGDISLLQQLEGNNTDAVLVGAIEPIRASRRWGSSFSPFMDAFEPSSSIQFYAPRSGKVTITIETESGDKVQELSVDAAKGLNSMPYDLTVSDKGAKTLGNIRQAQNGKKYISKGIYTIKVSSAGKTGWQKLEIK